MSVGTINQAKERGLTYQPLLLAEFIMPSGPKLCVASHPLNVTEGGFQYGGQDYLARVINYEISATQALSDLGVDYTPSVTISMADVTKELYVNYAKPVGFKGALVKLTFIFWNVGLNDFSSDSLVKFVGICGTPEVKNDTLTVTASSLLNMSQTMLPAMRVQKRCPWIFPVTADQRAAAADDESSPFWLCGYSAGCASANACGNLTGADPFTSCMYTYEDCLARLGSGLCIIKDQANRHTGRYGGIHWYPPTATLSRGYISGKWEEITNTSNEAKYGDLVPLQYGEAWSDPLVLNTYGDANFTWMQVLLGWGQFQYVSEVIVNGVKVPHTYNDGIMPQVPKGINNATDASKTGWWLCLASGGRNGNVDPGTHIQEQPDPYGNLCVLQVAVPKSVAEAKSAPKVSVLAQGPKIRVWYEDDPGGGTLDPETGKWYRKEYTDTLAWVLLDVLTWAGWRYTQANISSFITYAAICDAAVSYKNMLGVTGSTNADGSTHKRYSASLVLRQRRSAMEVVRGLRNAGKALLFLDKDGLLTVQAKRTLAEQQPDPVPGSNYDTHVASFLSNGNNAWGHVAYLFDESNIAKGPDGKTPSLNIAARSIEQAPNCVAIPFQDRDNQYTPDSMSFVDAEDIARVGQQLNGSMNIDGLNNQDQGRRCAATWFAETYRGNERLNAYGEDTGDTGGTDEFQLETTFKVIHLKIGDLCLLNYQHYGISNQLVRITGIQPNHNFSRVKITAWHHKDAWYLDTYGQMDAPLWRPKFRNREARPSYSWCPYYAQALQGDSFHPQGEKARGFFFLRGTAPASAGDTVDMNLDTGAHVIATYTLTAGDASDTTYETLQQHFRDWLNADSWFSAHYTATYVPTDLGGWSTAGIIRVTANASGTAWNLPWWITVTSTGLGVDWNGLAGGTDLAVMQDWGMGVAQVYNTASDGKRLAKIQVLGGSLPVNQAADVGAPFVRTQGTSGVGGSIPGDQTLYFMVCANKAALPDYQLSTPSKIISVHIPAGSNSNYVNLSTPMWADNTAGYVVFMGRTPNKFWMVAEGTGTPSSITLTTIRDVTWGVPDSEFDHMMLRVIKVRHGGVWGQQMVSCTAHTVAMSVLPGAGFGTNQFAGYDVTLLALRNVTEAVSMQVPILTLTVNSNTADTLTFSSGAVDLTTLDRGDGTTGLQLGDVWCMRSKPTVGADANGNYIEDLNFVNNLCLRGDPYTISAVTAATPIQVTTDVAHPYETGDKVYQHDVVGITAANGLFTVTKLDAHNYTLDGTAGTGAYVSGGLAEYMYQGLISGLDKGYTIFFIQGPGKGTRVKIKDNTATRFYIEGDWPVTPDSTSRFIVLESQVTAEAAQQTVNNSAPMVQVSATVEVENGAGATWFIEAATVDGGGSESFESDTPFREIFVYGKPEGVRVIRTDSWQQPDDVNILVDSTDGPVTLYLLSMASVLAPRLLIKKVSADANLVTIVPFGDEQIDGQPNKILTDQWDFWEGKRQNA